MKNDVITLPDGHTIRYEFDDEDRTIKVIDQLSNSTNVTYDDAGRVLSKRLPDGALVQYEYDKVGNVVKETMVAGINKFLRIYYGKVTELYRELEA